MSRCRLQIRREPEIAEAWGRLTVSIDNRTVFDLDDAEVKQVSCEPGVATITVTASDGSGFSRRMCLPEGRVLLLSLHEISPVWWRRLLGISRSLDLTEISKGPLVPPDAIPDRTLTQQVWIGHAASEEALSALFVERDGYYSDENAEREGTPDHLALSAFAQVMGQASYDHDFLEYSYAGPGDSLETRFAAHSWVREWAPVLRALLPAQEIEHSNAVVMVGIDRHERFGDHRQIRQPRDLYLPDLRLRYIGEIDHPDHS
ncbi:hypothetical protein J2T09_000830 [Neorhizobium huautlense]|uniref:Uncharacterized protein n=1 Tax=Neorhizobium huautlense TaxID=67774 RepID=A0ABT9PPN2_9HYPH|nr:hypothetical protein [Neorhizobium huautlense]MDP9836088.1 hypothetical protein [Neorhizobium huautlense]